LAIGDALGMPTQLLSRAEIRGRRGFDVALVEAGGERTFVT